MVGDPGRAGKDLVVGGRLVDLDHGAHILHGHGIARRRDGDERIGGHASLPAALVTVGGPSAERGEGLPREALAGPLVRGAVHALVGDGDAPLLQPGVQRRPRGKLATRQGVAFDILHPRLDLALRLRPVGLTRPRSEPVGAGEVLEDGMPEDATLATPEHLGAGIVVETGQRDAAEVVEGALVAIEQHV